MRKYAKAGRAQAEADQREFDRYAREFPEVAAALVQTKVHAEATAMDADRVLERFSFHVEGLRRSIAYADQAVTEWRTKLFDNNPASAFEWAREAMEAAAKAEVLGKVLQLTLDLGPVKALRYATEEALRGARWPTRSTSGPANIMGEARTSAWAEFVAESRS